MCFAHYSRVSVRAMDGVRCAAAFWAVLLVLFRWHVVPHDQTCVMSVVGAPVATMRPGELWWRWSPLHSIGHCVGHPNERVEVGPVECTRGGVWYVVEPLVVALPIKDVAQLVTTSPQWRVDVIESVSRSVRAWCAEPATEITSDSAGARLEDYINAAAAAPRAITTVGAVLEIPAAAVAKRAAELAMINALGPEYYVRLLAANNTALQVYTPHRR